MRPIRLDMTPGLGIGTGGAYIPEIPPMGLQPYDIGRIRTPGANVELATTEETNVNPRIATVGRRYMGMGSQAIVDGVMGSLVQKMAPPRKHDVSVVERFHLPLLGDDSYGLYGLPEDHQAMNGPMLATAPHIWNLLRTIQQSEWLKDNPKAYHMLTPSVLFHGMAHRDPGSYYSELSRVSDIGKHAGYSLMDGAVASLGPPGSGGPYSVPIYSVTGISRGAAQIFDYWEGRGITTGARLYFVLRKFASDRYPHHHSVDFFIPDAGLDADVATKMAFRIDHESPPVQVKSPATRGRFFPYMLAAVAVPDGGPLDRDYLTYTDEDGIVRYDGLALEVGRVLYPARNSTYRAPPTPNELTPITNAGRWMPNTLLDVVMNTDDGRKAMG